LVAAADGFSISRASSIVDAADGCVCVFLIHGFLSFLSPLLTV
jgi:hypothetical protein